jgi:tRNA threonylcarbamoyladenosine biosynthesis protein TsaE
VPPLQNKHHIELTLASEAQTNAVGASLAKALRGTALPFIVTLVGELGAGKTTLARALLRELGVTGRVKSPTYALVEVYVISGLNLYHFDFYRLKDPDEWHESGFRDYLTEPALSLIEWPQKALGAGVSLPQVDLEITLLAANETTQDARIMRLLALSPQAQNLLAQIRLA